MLGSLTSLTGGGGFTGGSASASNGDQSQGGSSFGGISFGSSPQPPYLTIALIILVGFVIWKS